MTQNRPAYEQEERFLALWEIVQAYTMTGPERGYALWLAVNAVVDRDIDGAMVESWRLAWRKCHAHCVNVDAAGCQESPNLSV